jgi:hypothetical protein
MAEDNKKSKLIGLLFVLFLGPIGLAYTSVPASLTTVGIMLFFIVSMFFMPLIAIPGCIITYFSIFYTQVKLSKDWVN